MGLSTSTHGEIVRMVYNDQSGATIVIIPRSTFFALRNPLTIGEIMPGLSALYVCTPLLLKVSLSKLY